MNDHTYLDDDCIFCKIIKGEIPSFKVFEDDKVFAFMDINPIQPGHSLVIPKFHTANIFDAPDEWAAVTLNGIQRLARAVNKTLEPDGINILQANGPGAAQSVFHLHMHVVPRAMDDEMKMNWGIHPGDMGEIEKLAQRIRENLD
jgi:histidine triad (HIT) family protein